jgi:hypothetical protein
VAALMGAAEWLAAAMATAGEAAAGAAAATSTSDVLKLLVTASLLYLCYLCVFLRSYARDLDGNELPGPPAHLFFGNAPDLADGADEYRDRASEGMLLLYQKHGRGGLCAFRPFGNLLFVVVCSREGVKEVLTKSYLEYPKGLPYRNIRYALGRGLVTANGEKWRTHRRISERAFHRTALRAMLPQFAKHTAQLLDIWAAKAAASPTAGAGEEAGLVLDAHAEMQALTLDIICEVGFGYIMDSKSGKGEGQLACAATNALLEEMGMRFKDVNPLARYMPGRWLRGRRALRFVDAKIWCGPRVRLPCQPSVRYAVPCIHGGGSPGLDSQSSIVNPDRRPLASGTPAGSTSWSSNAPGTRRSTVGGSSRGRKSRA